MTPSTKSNLDFRKFLSFPAIKAQLPSFKIALTARLGNVLKFWWLHHRMRCLFARAWTNGCEFCLHAIFCCQIIFFWYSFKAVYLLIMFPCDCLSGKRTVSVEKVVPFGTLFRAFDINYKLWVFCWLRCLMCSLRLIGCCLSSCWCEQFLWNCPFKGFLEITWGMIIILTCSMGFSRVMYHFHAS